MSFPAVLASGAVSYLSSFACANKIQESFRGRGDVGTVVIFCVLWQNLFFHRVQVLPSEEIRGVLYNTVLSATLSVKNKQ